MTFQNVTTVTLLISDRVTVYGLEAAEQPKILQLFTVRAPVHAKSVEFVITQLDLPK